MAIAKLMKKLTLQSKLSFLRYIGELTLIAMQTSDGKVNFGIKVNINFCTKENFIINVNFAIEVNITNNVNFATKVSFATKDS